MHSNTGTAAQVRFITITVNTHIYNRVCFYLVNIAHIYNIT